MRVRAACPAHPFLFVRWTCRQEWKQCLRANEHDHAR
jgi:hypothetical protein